MQRISDVMTRNLVTLPSDASLVDAASAMRDNGIGDVLVLDDDNLRGLVTDRDIVVRAVAGAKDPQQTRLAEVCSGDVVTVSADDDVSRAIDLMQERAIRRLPVVDGGKPVGIVSIGDLAIEGKGEKALDDISAARPNN